MTLYRERYIEGRQMFVRYTTRPSVWAWLRGRVKVLPELPRIKNANLLCLDGRSLRRGIDSNWLRRIVWICMPAPSPRRTRILERI